MADLHVCPKCNGVDGCKPPCIPHARHNTVRRGFYRHYASADPYFVTSVSIRDEHGHGNVDAPRDVIYESTHSVESGLPNSRTEEEFTALVKWPDGVMRPRFVRVGS
jgi:hypothetical protein